MKASRLTVATTAFAAAILVPAAAHALVLGYVHMTSQQVRGVSATMRVEHRFPDIAEGQFVALVNPYASRADGHAVEIAWEIYESTATSDQFHPVAHLYFADGATVYPNDEYIWWSPTIVSAPAQHSLQLSQKVLGTDPNWNAYYDGAYVEDFWWPYPTSNTELTCQEVVTNGLGSSTFFSMGHTWNIKYRLSTGSWVSQSTTPASRISTWVSPEAVGYHIVWFRQYDDWAANR